jgi:hypothetical protein
MATDKADTTQAEEREETQEERWERIAREKAALADSPADDSLRARLLEVLRCNQCVNPKDGPGVGYERALFRYAAATSKAVALALQGEMYVNSNESTDTEFTTEEAAATLLGLSAFLDFAHRMLVDLHDATAVQP